MVIFISSDIEGGRMKQQVVDFLRRSGYEVHDDTVGRRSVNEDYPQFASRVANALRLHNNPDNRGILICGSGQGMCMAANRFKGIRAAICWDVKEARLARNDDDSNVLCLPAQHVGQQQAEAIITAWLSTPFAGAVRYRRRIIDLDQLD
jgi:ribose 5-phosphate isomerase B